MSAPNIPSTSYEIYRALAQTFMKGGGDTAVVTLLFRLVVEVEALREALASPETPEAVRQRYRKAYERTAVLSHNSAGTSGGVEKVLRSFFPLAEPAEAYAPEMAMLGRLGATEAEKQRLREEMDLVSTFT